MVKSDHIEFGFGIATTNLICLKFAVDVMIFLDVSLHIQQKLISIALLCEHI